jgi:chromosome segregation ATPase
MVHAHQAVKLGVNCALLQSGQAIAELESQKAEFSGEKSRLEAKLQEVESRLLDKTNQVSLLEGKLSALEERLKSESKRFKSSIDKATTRANRESFRAQQALSSVSRLKGQLATQDVVNQDLKATLNLVKRESQKNSERLDNEMQEILASRNETAKHLRSMESRYVRTQQLVVSLREEANASARRSLQKESDFNSRIKELKEYNIQLECEVCDLQGRLFDYE